MKQLIFIISCAFIFEAAEAFGSHGPSFDHNCTFCPCFYKYENRDLKLPNLPYLMMVYPTEDECLSKCWTDSKCLSVEYGISAGQYGIVCEFYYSEGLPNMLQYQYAFNYYQKRNSMECKLSPPSIRSSVQVKKGDTELATFRKTFATRPNPFAWGRR